MLNTQKWFELSMDELLVADSDGYTKEERLLFDSGLEVIFHDNVEEMTVEQKDVLEYANRKGLEVKLILRTINERIAVVLN
jgi:hypothetical protein